MKAYKIELLVIDHEGHGEDAICFELERSRYIMPQVINTEEFEIGEWPDDHPLNKTDTDVDKCLGTDKNYLMDVDPHSMGFYLRNPDGEIFYNSLWMEDGFLKDGKSKQVVEVSYRTVPEDFEFPIKEREDVYYDGMSLLRDEQKENERADRN
jgi:hypothetical protein